MKNILLKDALREEARETGLGFALVIFFSSLIGCAWIYWSNYAEELSMESLVANVTKTLLLALIAGTAAFSAAGYTVERGKKAVLYYRQLAKCPPSARGCR